MDISGWIFTDENPAHRFVFPAGSQIPRDGFLIICRDTTAFARIFPAIDFVRKPLAFGLSNSGEPLRLFDEKSRLVDSVRYFDISPWPAAADGDGPTLSLKNANLDNSIPEHWFASIGPGTPGSANKLPASVAAGDETAAILLLQNYPNPFRNSTTICFQLPENAMVELGIYNLLGQEISLPVQGKMVAGQYKMRWHPSRGIAHGVYLVRLQVGKNTAVRKMIYL